VCFVWIWEQTTIISLYNINWLVFITETECVYCSVRTGYLCLLRVNRSRPGRAVAQVAGLSPPRSEFGPRSVHLRFVMDTVALRQVFLPWCHQRFIFIFIYVRASHLQPNGGPHNSQGLARGSQLCKHVSKMLGGGGVIECTRTLLLTNTTFVLLLFITVSVLCCLLLNCIIKTVQVTEDAGRLLSGTDQHCAVIRWRNGRSLGTFQTVMPFRKSGSFG